MQGHLSPLCPPPEDRLWKVPRSMKKPPSDEGGGFAAGEDRGVVYDTLVPNNPPVMASPCQPPLHKGAFGAGVCFSCGGCGVIV